MAVKTDGKSIRELKEERADLVSNSRKIVDKTDEEKRDMNAEERKTFDAMGDDINSLTSVIQDKENDISRRSKLDGWEKDLDDKGRDDDPPRDDPRGHADDDPKQKRDDAFELELRGEKYEFRRESRDSNESDTYHRSRPEYRNVFRKAISGGVIQEEERRSLQADLTTDGGYLVPPPQFVARLIKAVDDILFIRGLATVTPVTSGEGLGMPSLDADPDDSDWTSELATGDEDTAMKFGKRELKPYPLAKRIKISRKLMRLAALNPESLVSSRLAYKTGVTEEKAFLTGTGSQQPLGVFTASADGVPTSQDIATGNATAITGDGLIDAKYALKSQYWAKARWMWHRDSVKRITKLKDNDNQYLWQPGLQQGEPDRLLGLPFDVSEFVPNTFTDQSYVGILCDWTWYFIADSLGMTIQRLMELYAETNQVGFIIRKETDAMPVLAEAFVRIKLGTS